MTRARTVTYECEKCGSEIVVTSTGEGELSPIYCCGIEVSETATTGGKGIARRRNPARKATSKKSNSSQKKTQKK